ncbi:PREDICTED: protein Spindly [Elephantulus edwardii]|uniref:protein Spindly n=1 Tax=Elephantulus edwardii TaxID=28737 RepID=UPI0003F06EDC|nr:PREDICTED: protein Spindly [Elephantulus edwardii]
MEEDKIAALRSKLREVEDERLKAAQYGLQLVESQNELQNQLDKCRNEMMTMTENYEQEKYTLQREVELKSRMLESLNSECEAIKHQQKIHLEQLEEQLNRRHGQEVNELKNKYREEQLELLSNNLLRQVDRLLQIATLLQMKGSQTEFEQQQRLFAMLEQKNGEIKHLLGEIRNLEKFKNIEVPILKKRREVLPLDINTATEECANKAVEEDVYNLPTQGEEAQSYPNNLEDHVQLEKTVSANTPEGSLSPHKSLSIDEQRVVEKKRVKLVDIPVDSEALSGRSGNCLNSPRLTAESKPQAEVKEGKGTASKLKKETCKKSHPILYVSSKSTPETQCPQQ